jgi:uncharacterized repeat protein (TIGR01451 family)/MYXO-CTERM domain-containing protein
MVHHARLAVVIAALGIPTVAHARPIESSDDPALADAITHGFEGIADATPGSAAFVLGRTLVTIEAAAPPSDVVTCNDPTDCTLVTYNTAAVTITFDPPVAAVGLFMWYSVGPFGMVVTGDAGIEMLDDESLGWQHPASSYGGAADIGAISTVLLTAEDYSTYWDDLRIVEGGAAGTGADVTLASTMADETVAASATFAIDLRAHDLGPGTATETEIVALLSPGSSVSDTTPVADVTDTHASFTVGELASGDDADVALELVAPAAATFGCDDVVRTIAVVHHTGGDAEPGNNITVVDTAFDRASAPAVEDCTSFDDDDCDGMVNCLDDDCLGGTQCPIALPDLAQQPYPPLVPWIDAPEHPLEQLRMWSDPWNITAESQECRVSDNHGGTVLRPAMCCGPAPGIDSEHPSYFQWWNACTPIDPNFKSAVPATNAAGFGTTAAGESIEYTITYENIGGVDAHGVVVIDVLSAELDDASLTMDDGGVYDTATRTLSWIDPVLPPHEPHTVHYAIAVRDDAPPGTRVQNMATIVFPDAVPPSRTDTSPVVHVIPDPLATVAVDLRVTSCERTGAGSWSITVVNAGLAPAYDATARIVGAPADFAIEDDGCALGHPDDPEPEQLAIVIPWATTRALDEVRFTAPADHEDPCAEVTWELGYYTLDGERRVTQSRLEPAPGGGDSSSGDDGSGSDDDGGGAAANGDDGCSCRTHDDRRASAWLVLLGLVAIARPRRSTRAQLVFGVPTDRSR